MKSLWVLLIIFFGGWILPVQGATDILNVYTWSGEIPGHIVKQFEKETGIKVNLSSYDNNEIMYAKLRTNSKGYDIVEPSGYYIQRMLQQGMLEKLDKTKLPNFKYVDPFFVNPTYDPNNEYSIPFVWGITGIFYNKDYFTEKDVASWSDFRHPRFKDRLLLLDESRSNFSAGLRMLDYSINDKNPAHIKEAYIKLKDLLPNIRLFNSDAVLSILIDEDAIVGMAWNADVYNAIRENNKLGFVFPSDGFEIWVDTFILLKEAPHKENAYRFLNFLMRPDVARAVSMSITYATTNLAARELLPSHIKNNSLLYPSYDILSRGEFQTDHGEEVAALFEKYWVWLKMGVMEPATYS